MTAGSRYVALRPGAPHRHDALGVLDWIDAAMVRAEDADARNEELAARAN